MPSLNIIGCGRVGRALQAVKIAAAKTPRTSLAREWQLLVNDLTDDSPK